MARDIDRLLDYIRGLPWLPPVHREVIINRIDVGEPTQGELDHAWNLIDQQRFVDTVGDDLL